MIKFANLTTEKRIDKILLSLTQSDHLSNTDSGSLMNEEPGVIYLRNLIYIQKKYLLNYEFNTLCLAERRIFLAYYQTIQTSNRFHYPSPNLPFSLRLPLSPSRGILVIGSIKTGRSYLVKYLATNSYVPFVTVFRNRDLVKVSDDDSDDDLDSDSDSDNDFYSGGNIDEEDDVYLDMIDDIDDSKEIEEICGIDVTDVVYEIAIARALEAEQEFEKVINEAVDLLEPEHRDPFFINLQFELAKALHNMDSKHS